MVYLFIKIQAKDYSRHKYHTVYIRRHKSLNPPPRTTWNLTVNGFTVLYIYTHTFSFINKWNTWNPIHTTSLLLMELKWFLAVDSGIFWALYLAGQAFVHNWDWGRFFLVGDQCSWLQNNLGFELNDGTNIREPKVLEHIPQQTASWRLRSNQNKSETKVWANQNQGMAIKNIPNFDHGVEP